MFNYFIKHILYTYMILIYIFSIGKYE
jgi:hypothetical protein